MNEIEYLQDRAQTCRRMARTAMLPREIDRLVAQAAAFERQAATLKAQ
jgi:hypothetical protein